MISETSLIPRPAPSPSSLLSVSLRSWLPFFHSLILILIWLPLPILSLSFVPVFLSPDMSFSPLLTFLFFPSRSYPSSSAFFPLPLFPYLSVSPVAFSLVVTTFYFSFLCFFLNVFPSNVLCYAKHLWTLPKDLLEFSKLSTFIHPFSSTPTSYCHDMATAYPCFQSKGRAHPGNLAPLFVRRQLDPSDFNSGISHIHVDRRQSKSMFSRF